ncbi:acetyl-CoA carboxylase biotin carboxyl carrier protein subunit, partial [Pseudomonas aeruginosa]|nr:acetyl-CoA carboxylase biotin carboxyl carrier protein subunit [Pseudomonas aeruginosa]
HPSAHVGIERQVDAAQQPAAAPSPAPTQPAAPAANGGRR